LLMLETALVCTSVNRTQLFFCSFVTAAMDQGCRFRLYLEFFQRLHLLVHHLQKKTVQAGRL
jgi:hypothetical protein